MPPIKKYPRLLVVPKPGSESFEIMIKSGPNNVDMEYIGRVNGIQWDTDGPIPDWTMKHPRIKTNPNERIPNLPSAPTKKQFVVLGAKHFFGDKEFSTRELVCVLREKYPLVNMKLEPRIVCQYLNKCTTFRSRYIEKGKVNSVVWKCIEPSDENLQSQDVKQPSFCLSTT